MNMEDRLFNQNLDLSNLLENLILENSDLQMNWLTDAYNINNRVEYHSYLTMKESPANKIWVQQFLNQFTPLYEQLSLYHDYYEVRTETLTKDADKLEVLEALRIASVKVAKELLLSQQQRVERIELLDDNSLKKGSASKAKLLYLARNTPSTLELFDLLGSKLKNPILFHFHSDETNQEMADCFEGIQVLNDAVLLNPNEEVIVFYLTTLLLDFYEDLKELICGMRGRKLNYM
ncbi:hypothetical protein [Lysinibacillus sp. SGAir0095]|uniref:hypothetical protein n=1 Tax=Lysinibacillus sp. SGAir0095 TaxID=2070463 RepID=UPI0010CD2DBD|nr:hypothetical protein [Lysinibacillus sp. SGAir0095]QCR31892.1 hypothetical protein C1N55_06735 [Lysinibacillus sp. SGAir0095]